MKEVETDRKNEDIDWGGSDFEMEGRVGGGERWMDSVYMGWNRNREGGGQDESNNKSYNESILYKHQHPVFWDTQAFHF